MPTKKFFLYPSVYLFFFTENCKIRSRLKRLHHALYTFFNLLLFQHTYFPWFQSFKLVIDIEAGLRCYCCYRLVNVVCCFRPLMNNNVCFCCSFRFDYKLIYQIREWAWVILEQWKLEKKVRWGKNWLHISLFIAFYFQLPHVFLDFYSFLISHANTFLA